MTKLLDRAIEAAREMPADRQDQIAHLVTKFVNGGEETYMRSQEEEASFKSWREQAARGEFASEQRMQELWKRFSR